MHYYCCTTNRRTQVKQHPVINGIDFLEVLDNKNDPVTIRQRTLYVHFIKDIAPGSIQKEQVIIEGGERITNIKVISITEGLITIPATPDAQKILVVQVDVAGDYSTYTLRLVQDVASSNTLAGYDPVLSAVDFSFKVLCPSDFDCRQTTDCGEASEAAPEINYLAKDYDSFRQLMLDRMALLSPGWTERNAADLGVTLVELLAYAGDYLSYRQDFIATEAYLGTARKRVSVRRHARLVDYFMHDGCNARTWVHIETGAGVNGILLQKTNAFGITRLLTKNSITNTLLHSNSPGLETALNDGAIVFELMHDLPLYYQHNQMQFYTWGESVCWLCKGATSATLLGHYPQLQKGMVLILTEMLGPETGDAADANPLHRYPVCITSVQLKTDPIGKPLTSPYTDTSLEVTEITWDEADALPEPLCISAKNNKGSFNDVSIVLGNNLLADHGYTITEQLPRTPEAADAAGTLVSTVVSACTCTTPEPATYAARYQPVISYGPLTQAAPLPRDIVSAAACSKWSMRDPLPAIALHIAGETGSWTPARDLLQSKPEDKMFVAEVEEEGTTSLRFGDDASGKRPAPGILFNAAYRVGNGPKGNIGANVFTTLVSDDPAISSDASVIHNLWNPLPGFGGTEPESIQLVKQNAPVAFRTQERAVTQADYEEMTRRSSNLVQRSAATTRWTGSWRTVFVTVDRLGGEQPGDDLQVKLRQDLEKYRLAGYDLEMNTPLFVSLELKMRICVNKNYFSSAVKAALLETFSNNLLPNGRKGLFHADNFTFGQTVYLSRLYAAAQKIAGVDSVSILTFQRQGQPLTSALASGKLALSRLEIARLDNDPNFPERGVLTLDMQGGR
ncbi:putative baseplate assembly protein [Filimonas lacunae]|uniref:Putative baseplate assembly protein n=1 Tax=Filimonas lacunae TaxID=477680 RepID=A0A173MG76_9BACT|nr:putative baseplate assembly protein [Filimonas lacunae]BAV06595.1 hypothetical protein FLA_2614 [Filimonas lacunae]SIT27517.1 putative baseplate assembly protein [Filimonas lacunae]